MTCLSTQVEDLDSKLTSCDVIGKKELIDVPGVVLGELLRWAELIFGGTSGTGGRVNFFVSCVNFLEKQCYIISTTNDFISVQIYTYCIKVAYKFTQYVKSIQAYTYCVNLWATFTQNV